MDLTVGGNANNGYDARDDVMFAGVGKDLEYGNKNTFNVDDVGYATAAAASGIDCWNTYSNWCICWNKARI